MACAICSSSSYLNFPVFIRWLNACGVVSIRRASSASFILETASAILIFVGEIHVHHLTESINDFLYFVKKYFQKYRFFFKKSLDIIKEILYNIGVRRSGKLTGKENRPMDEKAKALKELLEILVEHPDLAERITITIKPNRIIQSNETPTDNK